jgi:hypothetical protein
MVPINGYSGAGRDFFILLLRHDECNFLNCIALANVTWRIAT